MFVWINKPYCTGSNPVRVSSYGECCGALTTSDHNSGGHGVYGGATPLVIGDKQKNYARAEQILFYTTTGRDDTIAVYVAGVGSTAVLFQPDSSQTVEMLSLFEDITHGLTEEELQLVPKFVNSFTQHHVGKDKAVKAGYIVAVFKKLGVNLSEARVRKIINHIRSHELVHGLMAGKVGYYITNDPEEYEQYVNSLRGRISSMMNIKRRAEEHLQRMKLKQRIA